MPFQFLFNGPSPLRSTSGSGREKKLRFVIFDDADDDDNKDDNRSRATAACFFIAVVVAVAVRVVPFFWIDRNIEENWCRCDDDNNTEEEEDVEDTVDDDNPTPFIVIDLDAINRVPEVAADSIVVCYYLILFYSILFYSRGFTKYHLD